MKESLLLMDTDGIKNYVFGTNKLRDIRGASAILDELNRIEMTEIVKRITNNNFVTIFSNGGVGEFVVPTDCVNQIIESVKNAYNENGASVTCTSLHLDGDFNIQESDVDFQIKQLAYDLQSKKSGFRTKIAISNPFFRTCDICHEKVASVKDVIPTEFYICHRCQSKRDKLAKLKAKTKKYFRTTNPLSDKSMRSRLIEELKKLEKDNKLEFILDENLAFPDEIEDVNESENDYIGLIYADGNNMRREIEKRKKLPEHRDFSESIDDAIFSSLASAINKFLHPYQNTRHKKTQIMFPFDVLLLGGDDLIIVCQAKKALNVAIEICNTFYKETKEKFSLSIGVALAHTNFPIRLLLKIAENLLKVAKTERVNFMRYENDASRKNAFTKNRIEEFRRGAINFMTISNSASLLYEDYYNDSLESEYEKEKFVKTFRPYSPKQLERLLELGEELIDSKFPKSKLEYLGEALFSGKFNSMLKSLVVFTRAKTEQKALLRQLFNFYPELEMLPPWQTLGYDMKTKKTAILDILEIYRFLGESKNED